YKDDAKIVGHYLGLLRQVGADAEAAELIENYSLKHWQDEFALLYSELKLTDSAKHLKKAEAWLSQRADNASLLLSLGRLSLKAELWGKAREYFEASIKISPDPVSFAELQRLLRNLADTKAVEELSHTYAQHIEASLPLLPMPSKLLSND
ncbi:MAG: heme biosynthesis protein HemY, partial [SAR86 cluster bacterium]